MQSTFNIGNVVGILGLSISPNRRTADSFSCVCPFCGRPDERKYKLNVCVSKDAYHCFRCGAAGGKLDLYSRVRRGVPAVKGENTREIYREICDLLGNGEAADAPYAKACPLFPDVSPAPDERLDHAYRALLSLPYLKLNDTHRENLHARGLKDEEISLHGYASLSETFPVKADYRTEIILIKAKKELPEIGHLSEKELLIGLAIADDLVRQGIDLSGVPGFFRIAGRWCMRITFGILIPTIGMDGRIVGIQTRRSGSSGARYLTLSAKGFPDGVTRSISRTHIVKDDISPDTLVFLTEGPLKADVIYHLLHRRGFDNLCIIALQGVNSVNELPQICRSLAEKGVTEINEVFDMDKVTNTNVDRALVNAERLVKESGLKLRRRYWDAEYGHIRLKELRTECLSIGAAYTAERSLWQTIMNASMALKASDIALNGKWRSETKGFDDYLKYISQSGS